MKRSERCRAVSGFSKLAVCLTMAKYRCANCASDILESLTYRVTVRCLTYGNECFLGRRHRHLADRVNDQLRFIQMNPVCTRRCNYLLDVIANLPQAVL